LNIPPVFHELYGRVRRAVRVEGRSERAVAREFGISREAERKMPVVGRDRRDSGRGQAAANQAAAHG
jgi:hypothetical protein